MADHTDRIKLIAFARDEATALLRRAKHESMQMEIKAAMLSLNRAEAGLQHEDVDRRASILRGVDLDIGQATYMLGEAKKALDTYGDDVEIRG